MARADKGKAQKAAKGKQKAAPASGSGAAKEKKRPKPGLQPGAFGDALERELAAVGLRVHKITADGNCMFRAAADQLHGEEGRHEALRQRACDLMEARRGEFEPFVEDDQAFDAYLKRMRKVGGRARHGACVPVMSTLYCSLQGRRVPLRGRQVVFMRQGPAAQRQPEQLAGCAPRAPSTPPSQSGWCLGWTSGAVCPVARCRRQHIRLSGEGRFPAPAVGLALGSLWQLCVWGEGARM
jgi:hypothetical protein